MRKILISILIFLMLIGSAFFVVNGFNKMEIKGVKGLSEKNNEVEQKIIELTGVINSSYSNAWTTLKSSSNSLQQSKTEYENQAILSEANKSSYISQLELYDIDYLWTKLGNYAKDEGTVIKIDVMASGASSNLYNLNFTVTGTYVGTTNFIYDIENDSKLGFKIDDFAMTASTEEYIISATFTCKDIPINVGNIDSSKQSTNNLVVVEKPLPDDFEENTAGNTPTQTNSISTTNTVNNNTSTTSNTTTKSNTTGTVDSYLN